MSDPVTPVLEAWDGLEAAGGALRATFPRLPEELRVVTRDDGVTTLTGRWDLATPIGDLLPAALLVRPLVLRLVAAREGDGDDFAEYELGDIEITRTADGGSVTWTATRPTSVLRADVLAEATAAGGERTALSVAGLTLAELVTGTVVPGLPAWVVAGVAQGAAASVRLGRLAWEDRNRQDLLDQARDAVRATGSSCVWRWRRVGRTQYAIDVGDSLAALDAALGSPAAAPEVIVGVHVAEATTGDEAAEQLTVGRVRGSGGAADAEPGRSTEHAVWRVSAVNVGAQTVTLEDPDGGAGPIAEDDECVDAVRPYALQARTGRLYAITDTAAPGTLTLAEAPVSVAVGDRVELRRDAIAGVAPPTEAPAEITALGSTSGGAQTVTLGAWGFGPGDPVAANGQYEDARGQLADPVVTRDLQHVSSDPPNRLTSPLSLSAVHVGDLFAFNGSAREWTVVAVDAGGAWIDVVSMTGATITGGISVGGCVIYRPRSGYFRAAGAVASANTVALRPAAGSGAALADLAVGQIVRWSRDVSGALVTELAPPAGVAQYGRIVGVVTRRDLDGATNVVPNADLSAWSAGASSPPDGFTVSGATVARVGSAGAASTYAGTVVPEYGPYLGAFTVPAASWGSSAVITCPVTSWLDAGDTARVSVAVRLVIDADPATFSAPASGGVDHGLGLEVVLDVLDAGGGLLTSLGPSTAEWCYTAGRPLTYAIHGLTLPRGARTQLRLIPRAGQVTVGGTPFPVVATVPITVYVDAVLVARGATAPTLRAGSDAVRLWQALHDELALRRHGVPETRLALRDLARRDPDAWGHAAAPLGAAARVRTPAGHVAPLDATLLVAERAETVADPEATQLTVRSRARQLLDLLSQISAAAAAQVVDQALATDDA